MRSVAALLALIASWDGATALRVGARASTRMMAATAVTPLQDQVCAPLLPA